MKLFAPTTECLCLHLLPSYDRVELVHLSLLNGQILNRGSIGIQGNSTTRTISDTEHLEEQLRSLMAELSVPASLPVHLILPSLYTRLFPLPEGLEPEDINGLLINEAEKFVFFKKTDPQVAWCPSALPERILYTAYPAIEVDMLLGCLARLKLQVESLELNYTSLIKGLATTGLIEQEMEQDLPWCLLVVNEGMFFVALMRGEQFEQVQEVPLSTGATDEIQSVEEIQQDFEHFLGTRELSRLIVVNNTVTVSSSRLVKRLGFVNNSIVIEQTSITVASLGSQAPQYESTIEALGVALAKGMSALPTLQLLPPEKLEKNAFVRLESKAFKAVLVLNAAVLLLLVVVWGGLSLYAMTRQFELNRYEKILADTSLPSLNEKNLRLGLFVKQAIERNVAFNDLLITSVKALPPSLWFDKIAIRLSSDTDAGVTFEGGAMTPEPVNQFLTQLKVDTFPGMKDRPLEISKIDFVQSVTATETPHYVWSIQSKVAPAPIAAAPAPAPAAGSPPAAPGSPPPATPPQGSPPAGAPGGP